MRGVVAAMAAVVRRDLTIAARHPAELAQPLVFFVVAVSLFPLAIGPSERVLAGTGPGVLWVAALLASLLALDGLFRSDLEDGTLDQLLLSPQPVPAVVAAKVLAHWLVTGLPLLLLAPLLAVMLSLPMAAMPTLLATLALGTPALSLIGAVGVALTVALRRGGLLLSVLVLPLWVPLLIFATGAVSEAAGGGDAAAPLWFLGALLAAALTLAPLATAAALRVSAGG